jgi:hypothetical protein
MENKQTAVEWAFAMLGKMSDEKIKLQAKQMEKEQIKKAYKIGVAWGHNNMEEYYYSETYNKKDDA